MATWSDSFSGRPDHKLELVITEVSYNAATNTSSVKATLQVNPPSDSQSWNNYNDGSYSLKFAGSTYTGSWGYDFRTNRSTKVLKSVTKTITHNSLGAGTASASGSANAGSGTLGSASISTKTLTLTDFALVPTQTPAPAVSRNDDGTELTIVSPEATSEFAPVTDYEYRISQDNLNWDTQISLGLDRTATISVNPLFSYWVQTRALTADGAATWSPAAASVRVPTQPVTITVNRIGRDVTVVAGESTNAETYSVQISTNSGTTWEPETQLTNRTYTFQDLTPGINYRFRVLARNATGRSTYTVSEIITIPAGGKRFTGTDWTNANIARRFDGSAWVELQIARRFTGTDWVELQ